VLDHIEADRAAGHRLDPSDHVVAAEALQKAQCLDELPFAALAHAGFEESAEGRELFGQIPADQRRCLVKGAGLLLEQHQIMQWLEDEVLTLVGPGMAGDDVGAEGDHYRVDLAADQDLAMAVGRRH
jgi:hypothetical protein